MKTAEIISQSVLLLLILLVIAISFWPDVDNAMYPPENIEDTVIIKTVVSKEGYTSADAAFFSQKIREFKYKNLDATNRYLKTGNVIYRDLANSYMDSVYLYNSKIMWETR